MKVERELLGWGIMHAIIANNINLQEKSRKCLQIHLDFINGEG